MKTRFESRNGERGIALPIALVLCVAALVTAAGIMSWSAGTARLTSRSIQYNRCVAAAEAATEKAMSQINSDFLTGGAGLVDANLSSYRSIVPNSSDSSYWSDWQFQDGQGNIGKTYVNEVNVSNYMVLTGTYAGLYGFVSTYDIVSDAQQPSSFQTVVAGAFQEVQLTCIPVFQFAMYSSDDMEVSCGQPFYINGPVHANGSLYAEPDNVLTFAMTVSAVGGVLFQREPLDTRGPPAGSVIYLMGSSSNVAALTLPLGITNTQAAIRQIIEPPPAGEDATSAVGKLRYYNQADMIVNVSATSLTVTSGRFNSFGTSIPTNEWQLFIKTNASFYDWRESKTVLPVDIDVSKLRKWSATNITLRSVLLRDVSSIYVNDARAGSLTTLPAVRLSNGLKLPSLGLTVATARPMYVWGNYNQTNSANLNGTNTTTTLPASLVADAITILSPAWSDTNSTGLLTARTASSNTLNAAILAGTVYTTLGNYSGGMENFQRFLEDWSSATHTYNGSLVKMFASVYATNIWGKTNVYNPPTRQYSYDLNFDNPAKLPPLTPSLQTIYRNRWSAIAANQVTSTNIAW